MIFQSLSRLVKIHLPISILLLLLIACPFSVAASKSPISDFSTSFKRRLSESKVKSLVIADFTDPAGKPVPHGIYFADLLHLYLAEPPKKIILVNRELLGHQLELHKLSLADLAQSEKLRLLHDSVPAESIALGTVDETPQQVLLRVFVRRISDQTLVADQQVAIPQSDFYRSLVSYPNHLVPSDVFRAGEKGVSQPECEDCPAPQFRGPADGRLEKSGNTNVLLGLVITEEGRVARVKVLRGAGPEFEDLAWRNLRVFRFKPARNKLGRSVAAVIQMEVSFVVTVDY
jgi:hypothetical protein